MFAGV